MHNVVVMLPNNLGDVIMALPVLEAIKKQQPDCRITFVVEEGYEGGLVANRCCDRIAAIPRKTIKAAAKTPEWRAGLLDLARFLDGLKDGECDAVVNISQHPYLSYIATLLGAPQTVGQRFLRDGNHALPDAWSQYLYAIPFARRYNALHATDVYCRIAGVPSGGSAATITLREDERNRAGQYLAAKGCAPGSDIIIMQPGAAWSSKRWPPEAFAALGKKLLADGCRVVVTGAPAERESAGAIAAELGAGCHVAAGERTFRETIALLPFARLAITGDTATMHAAAGLGIRVYALFGPTNPVETGPYGSGQTVFAGRCPSRPCFKAECSDCVCMRSIDPAIVYGCIKGDPVGDAQCDIFTTEVASGVYRLTAHGGVANPLYDEAGAAITRRAFEGDGVPVVSDFGSPEVDRSKRFAGCCSSMERTLTAYLQQRRQADLAAFEQVRKEAAAIGGIAGFWTALLNIRLNSVPLLDPVAGLQASIDVCRRTGWRIARSIAP